MLGVSFQVARSKGLKIFVASAVSTKLLRRRFSCRRAVGRRDGRRVPRGTGAGGVPKMDLRSRKCSEEQQMSKPKSSHANRTCHFLSSFIKGVWVEMVGKENPDENKHHQTSF